ncbi:MAG: prepilin-type cleavage/methylation domain-containing protein [Halothiobacillus sp. 24-54-40]|jgi:type IV pilus assembly protein PilW|nr:MAG: prepilin-type cleavage/methylation domain-containing protein [Halothiobacillus sp. 20-53-49]OYY36172.1 MAG: prepilin-type cleavage/methylation domain-containing protein [Halothiobacillus sp. 35-54-62]OYZ86319.1 MAG: prepilin-type cleavage/methylation domain-containing protein [Halothiobacillus sp. 24-54-40]OZA80064.1 MAG: prepilin-type cleavage/methylation domain-containing protein [Halothiobacillus sp. 39-53-45]HQS02360.1 PilW family protein [Halothiobacillus sp.]
MKFTLNKIKKQTGFTLVELMISLVLGLVVVGGVISVFLATQQSYRTNQALGEVQDNSRTAFEFLARDIRDAGLTGCGNTGRVANVLNNSPANGGTDWWANWGNALIGYDNGVADPAVAIGTSVGQRVSATDSIMLIGAENSGLSVFSQNDTQANFKLNESTSNLQTGDIIMVCDPDHAVILQITDYNNNTVTLVHNTGNSVSPGNCSKGMGYPTACTTNGTGYTFGENSQIAQLAASDWYIGNNPVGGRSLYQITLANTGGVIAPTPQEMVRNVTDMQITYLLEGAASFVPASSVGAANWAKVDAVQIALILQSTDQRAGTDIKPITRQYTTTVTLRNRVN